MKQQKERADNRIDATGPQSKVIEKVDDNDHHDAISLLKADHREVEELFERYKSASRRADRAKITKAVARALTIHTILEEEIFYPACRELIDDHPLDEAQVEHDSAKILIDELLSGKPEDPFYDAKFKVLAEQVKHHIGEEEREPHSIFAQVEATGADLSALADRLKARKEELTRIAEVSGLHAALCSFTSVRPATARETQERAPERPAKIDYEDDAQHVRLARRSEQGDGPRDQTERSTSRHRPAYDEDDDRLRVRPAPEHRDTSRAERDERSRDDARGPDYRRGTRSIHESADTRGGMRTERLSAQRNYDEEDERNRARLEDDRRYARQRQYDEADDQRRIRRGDWAGEPGRSGSSPSRRGFDHRR